MAKKNTIIEDIRLTGGPEIEAALRSIGTEGEAAFKKLKASANSAGEQTALTKFVNQSIKDFKALGKQAQELGKTYKELGSSAKEFGRNVLELTTVVVAAGAGLFAFTKRAADVADDTGKAAQSAGLAIDQYGKLQFVFEQGNVDADSFGTAMKKLNTNIAEAAKGSGAGATLFQQLGIKVKDAAGNLRPTDAILQDLADKFQTLPDGPIKSALAIQLFGKAGAAIVPILNDGAKAIQALEDQAVSLGLVLDKNAAAIGQDFGDSLNALQRTIGGVSTQLGLLFAPAFTESFKAITQLIVDNRKAILDFGQVISSQVAPVIKDFISILEGKDDQVINKNLLAVRDTVVAIGQAVGILASIFTEVFNQLVDLVRPFVEIINEAFGTKFTAQAAVVTAILFALTGGFKFVGLGIKAVTESWALAVKLFGSSAGIVTAVFTGILATIATIQNAIDDIGTGFQALGAGVVSTFTPIETFFTDFASFIVKVWTGLTTQTDTLFSDMGRAITAPFQSFFDFISKGVDDALGLIKSVLDAASAAASAIAAALGGGDGGSSSSGSGGGGFAGGGHVRGAGTPTSDSIPAWLSDNEFVMRAAAVRRYGVGFMSMVNGLRLPKMGFAMGGLARVNAVPSMSRLPHFAQGGPVGRPFNLNIGGETFAGLLAPETVASKMVNYATGRVVRSAGRKPSWSV